MTQPFKKKKTKAQRIKLPPGTEVRAVAPPGQKLIKPGEIRFEDLPPGKMAEIVWGELMKMKRALSAIAARNELNREATVRLGNWVAALVGRDGAKFYEGEVEKLKELTESVVATCPKEQDIRTLADEALPLLVLYGRPPEDDEPDDAGDQPVADPDPSGGEGEPVTMTKSGAGVGSAIVGG